MADWLIARNTNMTFENVINLLMHPELNAAQANPAAAPNTLQDWGFLAGDKNPSDLGRTLIENKINWAEAVLVALSKRGANDARVKVKPFVVFAKVLIKLYDQNPDHAYLFPQAFDKLLTVEKYDDITDDFCLHVNDAGNGNPGTYWDIWYNALRETGLLTQRKDIGRGAIKLIETKPIVDFVRYVADNGERMSECPVKSIDNVAYFDYMGSLSTGIVEILKDAPRELIAATFPHYFALVKNGISTIAPRVKQDAIQSLAALVEMISNVSADSGLKYDRALILRLVAGLLAKPFLVLTGLSGSGKTKLAQVFTNWISGQVKLGEELLPGEQFKDGAYSVFDIDQLDYKIMVHEVDKLRTVSKNAVHQWLVHFKEHPDQWDVESKIPRREIQQIDTVDDNYMHGSDAILAHIARDVLSRRNPFVVTPLRTTLVVPVGADWTNNEKLLGYPNALDPEKYVLPDTGVLKLMLDARDNPNLPFFLILDEMNLSHVERYFADFLSTMESEEEIRLYDGKDRVADDGTPVPQRLKFPRNLFVIGTMNVDETTYMFSPKVLDRAQVIEFRVSAKEMTDFLSSPTCPNLAAIAGKGAKYAEAFLRIALERKCKKPGEDELKAVRGTLGEFFPELAKLGAEFGYRSAMEIVTFVAYYLDAAGYDQMPAGTEKAKVLNAAIDAAILQKLLPKLHGSFNRLGPVLDALIGKASKKIPVANDPDAEPEVKVIYKLTYEKLCRMKERIEKNGFTSFAEA